MNAPKITLNTEWLSVEQSLHEDEFLNVNGLPEAAMRRAYQRIYDDIDVITAMGATIHCNTWVGRDISMAQLEQQHDAVLVANAVRDAMGTLDAELPGGMDLVWMDDDGRFIEASNESACTVGSPSTTSILNTARRLRTIATITRATNKIRISLMIIRY